MALVSVFRPGASLPAPCLIQQQGLPLWQAKIECPFPLPEILLYEPYHCALHGPLQTPLLIKNYSPASIISITDEIKSG